MFNGSMYKLIMLRSVVPLLFSLMACTFYIPNFSLSIKILLQKNGMFIRGSTQMVKCLEVYGLFIVRRFYEVVYNIILSLFCFFSKFHFFQGGRRCSGLLSFTLSKFHCILAYYWGVFPK